MPLPRLLLLLASGALALAASGPSAKAKPKEKEKADKGKVVTGKVVTATVVVATRTERLESETPATVSAVDQEAMEARQTRRLQDLVRFEPGLSVARKPDRQGATSFNIRGIDENRVLVLVDGVKVPDGPASGHSFSRDLVDLGALSRVEILRGPGSALFGSDALGGVVSYTTKDARDLLAEGSRYGGGLRTGWDGADRSASATTTLAGRGDALDGILLATRREGHELEPAKGGANPLDITTTDLLGKVSTRLDAHTFRLSMGLLRRGTDARLKSSEGTFPAGPGSTVTVSDAKGDDLQRRLQGSVQHEWKPEGGLLERVNSSLYLQRARIDERSSERRQSSSGSTRIREGLSRFEQDIAGLSTQATLKAAGDSNVHRVTFGLDASRTETSRPRWRQETDPSTGATTTTVAGESYANKLFPDTTTDRAGVFVQDEWQAGDAWTFITGLRYDRTHMSPHPDAESQRSNALGSEVKGYDLGAFAPKLGILAKVSPAWSLYGQYAEGFRTPPYDDANLAFTNFAFRYTVLPNPDLKAERSRGAELGVKAESGLDRFAFTIFQNTYRDFIESVPVVPPPSNVPPGFLAFQSRNLASVRIRGVEAKGAMAFGSMLVQASAAWAEGQDLERNLPLESVDPAKAVLGVAWRPEGDRYSLEAILTGVARKTRVASATAFRTPGYGTVDVLAHWRPLAWLSLQTGVFNATDRTTWAWADVRGQRAGSPLLDRTTQPGRTFTFGASATWR